MRSILIALPLYVNCSHVDIRDYLKRLRTFNQMRTFLREICVPLQPADPLKLTASAALQNGLMFQPHSEDELFQMSNWTGRPKVRKHGGMAQSVEPTGQVIKLPVHEYLK